MTKYFPDGGSHIDSSVFWLLSLRIMSPKSFIDVAQSKMLLPFNRNLGFYSSIHPFMDINVVSTDW